MWSLSLVSGDNRSRGGEDLARYARWEYGEKDGTWLVSQARREARNNGRVSLRDRIAGFLDGRGSSEAIVPKKPSPTSTAMATDGGTLLTEFQTPGDDCNHDSLDFLGEGGNAAYYRCISCSQVVIAQGGMMWLLRHDGG